MKYWFFDGNDVVGPFTSKELVANKGFSATSLVCPENFSEESDQWQPALTFADLKALLSNEQPESAEASVTFDEELDSLLKETSPLSFDETPTDGPALQIPKKPSKPGPIEDYFNHIKEEDLGDILGIPDPNDNSDMDLAHALEKQLAKTSSTRRRQREEEQQEEQTAVVDAKEATHHVATVTEVFGPRPPDPDEPPTLPPLPSSTLPVLKSDEPLTRPAEVAPAAQPANTPAPAQSTVAGADFAAAATAADTPAQTQEEEPVEMIPNPALLRAEKVEVNSVRPRLKQTQEMKDFLNETQESHLKRQHKAQRKIMVLLLASLAIMVALACALQFKKRNQAALPAAPQAAAPTAQELLNDTPTPVPAQTLPAQPVEPAADTSKQSPQEQALAIVQNYTLSGNRGTIASYLERTYRSQLAQGYTADWGVEPLYKDTYIVKYRLTKTRKEPIIYVFQANVATHKLTGALNNISLDLVGKI